MKTLELFQLNGKVALVSGGTGIVGTAIVRGLAEAGATVVVASRDGARCEWAAEGLRAEGLRAEGERCDFAVEAELQGLRDRLLDRHGRVDVVFHNAVARAGGELWDTTAEDWAGVMELNSLGLFLSCQIFGEVLARQGGGSMVNVASIYGMVGPDFSLYEGTEIKNPVAYSFAKGGMINMTRYLASYLAPHGVRVNSISPGGVQTDATPERFVANYAKRVPMGRMARAEELRGAAVFLASDASSYVTGQNLAVDGGWTAI